MNHLIPNFDSWVTGYGAKTKYEIRGGARPDVTVLAGRCKFRVHRQILLAYSPVFKAMLEGNFKESTGIIDLREAHHYMLVVWLMQYLYTGDYRIPEHNGVNPHEHFEDNAQMYALADRYHMEGLKDVVIMKFGPLAAAWGSSMQPYLVKYVYTSTPPSDRSLRDLTKWGLKNIIDLHLGNDQWREFMDECEEFKIDMLDLASEQMQEDREEIDRLRQKLIDHGITP